MATYQTDLDYEEVLAYIAFAIIQKDLPKDFLGSIEVQLNEDGSATAYAMDPETSVFN
jgi:hypothetical protein